MWRTINQMNSKLNMGCRNCRQWSKWGLNNKHTNESMQLHCGYLWLVKRLFNWWRVMTFVFVALREWMLLTQEGAKPPTGSGLMPWMRWWDKDHHCPVNPHLHRLLLRNRKWVIQLKLRGSMSKSSLERRRGRNERSKAEIRLCRHIYHVQCWTGCEGFNLRGKGSYKIRIARIEKMKYRTRSSRLLILGANHFIRVYLKRNRLCEATVTLTFDHQDHFYTKFEESPSRHSWDIAFTRMEQRE